MALLTNSPKSKKFITGEISIPERTTPDNEHIDWLTNVLTDFKVNQNQIFSCATFLKDDLLEVGKATSASQIDYILFFPAIAVPEIDQQFKTLLAVGSRNNVYMMDGDLPICLCSEVVPVENNLDVSALTIVTKFVSLDNSQNTWSSDAQSGDFTSWTANFLPKPDELPFKNVAISNTDINAIFSINGCKKLGLIPITLRRNNNIKKRNTLIMVGLDQNDKVLLPGITGNNEIWVCDEAVNKTGSYPPWRSADLNSGWSV